MKWVRVLMLVGLGLLPAVAAAQGDGKLIEYGLVIEAELSNETFAIPYTFAGSAGDVIVVLMNDAEPLGPMREPAIILRDPQDNELGTMEGSVGSLTFAAQLPFDGTYTLIATRTGEASGSSSGPFVLQLIQPTTLAVDETITAEASSETSLFYLVEASGPFSLVYEKLSGEFSPEVTVNMIDDEFRLDDVAVLGGRYMSGGVLGLDPDLSREVEPFVVVVEEALFDFNFHTVTAAFELTLGGAFIKPPG